MSINEIKTQMVQIILVDRLQDLMMISLNGSNPASKNFDKCRVGKNPDLFFPYFPPVLPCYGDPCFFPIRWDHREDMENKCSLMQDLGLKGKYGKTVFPCSRKILDFPGTRPKSRVFPSLEANYLLQSDFCK